MTGTDSLSGKKVVIFDLDGTLTKSKSSLDREMASLLTRLLKRRCVAVASGCSFEQFETQFISKLPKRANLANLFLFPTCAASGYYYTARLGRFYRAYGNLLSKSAVKRIIQAFQQVFKESGYVQPTKTYGAILENRGSQVTFSALGQHASLELKEKWDPDQKKRLRMRKLLKRLLPNFEISIGGTTSIDVTNKGVNKTLCVRKLNEHLGVEKKKMMYVGDALFKGGNDYIMRSTRITCMPVSNPQDTKSLIRRIVKHDSA